MNIAANFRRQLFSFSALVLLVATSGQFTLAQSESGSAKTFAVVAATSFDELMKDVKFLGALFGRPTAAQEAEGLIVFFTQGKGLDAIDRTKPWGVVLQSDGANVLPVACLPVKKLDDLLAVATAYGVQTNDGGNGVKELTLPNQQTLFVKPSDSWAFLSRTSEALAQLPANPDAEFAKLAADYDLAASITVQNVPEGLRKGMIDAMQMGMKQGLAKQDSTDPDQQARAEEMAKAQLEQVQRLIEDLESVMFGWTIDDKQQQAFLDFTYRFLPKSKMAEQLASYGQPQTNFAGFYQSDAAVTATISSKADPNLIATDLKQFETMMTQFRDGFNKGVDKNEKIEDEKVREAIKACGSDWFDAFEATIKAGEIDAGGSLKLTSDSLTLVVGAHVKEPEKLESGLKKLEAARDSAPEVPEIKWNAENYSGVNFHTWSIPVPEEQESPHQLLGDNLDIAVGIGPESVYLAAGKDTLTAIKQAIDASKADPDKAVPPFELAISLAPIMEAVAPQVPQEEQREILESIATMLRNESQGRDHVRAIGKLIPNGLQYRLEVEEGVLRAVGKAAAAAQQRALAQ